MNTYTTLQIKNLSNNPIIINMLHFCQKNKNKTCHTFLKKKNVTLNPMQNKSHSIFCFLNKRVMQFATLKIY